MFDFHFFTLSSSLGENKSFIIAIAKKITARIITTFFIWNAIVVKASRIPSFPVLPEGTKKKSSTQNHHAKSSSKTLLQVHDDHMDVSRILISSAMISALCPTDISIDIKRMKKNMRIII